MKLTYRIRLKRSAADAFAWHERPGAFERFAPPWVRTEVLHRSGGIRNGGRLTMVQYLGPLPLRWEIEHVDFIPGRQFCDVARRSPFRRWRHVHRVESIGPDACEWIDEVDFAFWGGRLARGVLGGTTRSELDRLFAYRQARLKADLEAMPQAVTGRIVVAGASGLVGSALTALLSTRGYEVVRLVRRPAHASDERFWDPARPETLGDVLSGAAALVSLGGAGIADRRWSIARKAELRSSRLEGTRALVEGLRRASRPPSVFLSASAIGIYGVNTNRSVDETSARGDGFLAELTQDWEQEAALAESAGVRPILLRTGIVLSPRGGALARMLPIFRCGLGGPIGRGERGMSWISLEDEIAAIASLLSRPDARGAYNLVAPNPVSGAEFARELGRALHRPAFMPVPVPVLRAAFGEMATETILASQWVRPARLLHEGFVFQHASLGDALRDMLGTNKASSQLES
jgi:uncharacterized protein (TIGR01777 family)